ncbi:hypothetical protein [Bartonella sp. CB169]
MERKPLDFADLDDFKPRKARSPIKATERKEIDRAVAFPSREQLDEA